MARRYVVHFSVAADIKRRVKAAAAAEMLTPSAWLRRMIVRALGLPPSATIAELAEEHSEGPLDNRLCIRVCSDDTLLLRARATARGTRPSTYASVLLRSHLRALSPLPKEELLALKRAVSELGVLARDLHRIAQILSQEGAGTAVSPDLRAVTRLCETVRNDTKALLSANVDSWEIGRPPNAPPSYRNGGGRGARATGRSETGRLEVS
jgi:hypothetical protein